MATEVIAIAEGLRPHLSEMKPIMIVKRALPTG
jgi:hypothetical protein